MRITILGAGGFLGRKLAWNLAAEGALGGRPVTGLTLFDVAPPPPLPAPFPVNTVGGDVANLPAEAVPPGTDVIFHLAAVVSGAAEADYDLGRRVNLDGMRAVIDTCRALSRPPRVVFTSSVASFGGGQGVVLDDDARQVPANSYGTQKAIGEMLLSDASRRGFLDAVSLRLPTIIVRPGPAQQGSLQLLLRDRARAASRPADRVAGARRFRGLGRESTPRALLAAPCRRDGQQADGPRPKRESARASASRSARSCRRWIRSSRARPASSSACPTRRSRRSSAAGPRHSRRDARVISVSHRTRLSSISCALSSRTILRRRVWNERLVEFPIAQRLPSRAGPRP